jgi:phage terminase Nu1 subunit (DNA packaging protein)
MTKKPKKTEIESEDEIALISAEADRLAAENAERRAGLWNAGQVNDFWQAKTHALGLDLIALPSRIWQRLPHLTEGDIQAIAAEIRTLMDDQAHVPN